MTDLDELERLAKAAMECPHGSPNGWLFAIIIALTSKMREMREESARLDFMLENDAFTVRCNRDSAILQYQLMTQDEDENYHVLHNERRFFNTERDAIDAARATARATARAEKKSK